MSAGIRRSIGDKITQVIKQPNIGELLASRLEIPKTVKSAASPELILYDDVVGSILPNGAPDLLKKLTNNQFVSTDVEKVVHITKDQQQRAGVLFKLNPTTFVRDVLMLNFAAPPAAQATGTVVLEFSSPNIAKPFHVGHLRSTIIGNVLSNLYKHLGHDVIKLNYLGDWGTQFGMLQVGVELEGLTDNDMQNNPIESLYKAYVRANTEARLDSSLTEKARKLFSDLENNANPEIEKMWQKYRKYTITELEGVYHRLGVVFDEYNWESQYSQKHLTSILESMENKNLLHTDEVGRRFVVVGDRKVPVIKSDGSTLYLVRDIAALIDRYQRFNFNKIFYVVENGQTDHFNACFDVAKSIDSRVGSNAVHVKFGRIHGMSTRSGNVVFLKDLLNEARDIMLEKQLQSPTTKIKISPLDSSVADVLGVTAVIINDLKQRRQRDYNFDWTNALQTNGDTGIKLQYTHCRLSNLLENMSFARQDTQPQLSHLHEPEALELILQIARFQQSIVRSAELLEPCVLVIYLFSLCNATSRALKRLKVKDNPNIDVQANRLLLFSAAQEVLSCGMKILGIKPLTKM